MSRKSNSNMTPEDKMDWILSRVFSEPKTVYSISFNPESITEKAVQYKGQLVLVDRVKEIVENYGKEGIEYFIAPIKTTRIHTVETGILMGPLTIFQQIPEKMTEDYIVNNPQVGEIFVVSKAEIKTLQYHKPQKSDIRFSKQNIPLFLEDFIKEAHRIYGTEYNTNNESKFYSKVNSLNVIYGNDKVKEFLVNNYEGLGRNMLSGIAVMPKK